MTAPGWSTAKAFRSAWFWRMQFSARMNLASPDDARRVESHLKAVGLPTRMVGNPGNAAAGWKC